MNYLKTLRATRAQGMSGGELLGGLRNPDGLVKMGFKSMQ